MSSIGILVVNLGTPDAPTAAALRPYLHEFLSDQWVIDYPRWFWQPILQGIILRTRPAKSAALYASVWMDEGSPLLVYSERLTAKLNTAVSSWATAVLGMRYGRPSIRKKLEELRQTGCEKLLILPLYPQYSGTTVGTIHDKVNRELAGMNWQPDTVMVKSYHQHPLYVKAITDAIRAHWEEHGQAEKLIYSLHGIPARYVRKGDPYRTHCEETAVAFSEALALKQNDWQLTFQSRFGPEAWLQPYTDKTLEALGGSGTKRVDILCPGFATDCLETLEEIDGENREIFLHAGGKEFHYIPALNDSGAHVELLTAVAADHCADWL